MEQKNSFKQGFRTGGMSGTVLSYQLTILTENLDSLAVYRLAEAVDGEYRKILAEQYRDGEGGLDGWQIHHFD